MVSGETQKRHCWLLVLTILLVTGAGCSKREPVSAASPGSQNASPGRKLIKQEPWGDPPMVNLANIPMKNLKEQAAITKALEEHGIGAFLHGGRGTFAIAVEVARAEEAWAILQEMAPGIPDLHLWEE